MVLNTGQATKGVDLPHGNFLSKARGSLGKRTLTLSLLFNGCMKIEHEGSHPPLACWSDLDIS
jgi:hypothetical protein